MRSLKESILDTDQQVHSKIDTDVLYDKVRKWMSYATKDKSKELKDWTISKYQAGYILIAIYGNCPELVIDNELKRLGLLDTVRIIGFEPRSKCICKVKDPEAAEKLIGFCTIGNTHRDDFMLVYDTNDNLEPRHFPAFVYGDIFIRTKGDLNLSIMPNCNGELRINADKNVKYPAGFPTSVECINIIK